MSFRSIFHSIFLLFFLSVALPRLALGNDRYNEGLSHFQKGEFNEAKTSFEEALKEDPDNPYVLYNLALTDSRLGNDGAAVATWRKALALQPLFTKSREALNFTLEKMKVKALPHQITFFETIRNEVLSYLPWTLLLMGTGLLFLSSGWFLFQYLGLRKRNKKAELPTHKIPFLAITFALLFLVCLLLTILKYIDYETPRATVTVESAEAKTAPGADQATLFELYKGLEVIVREVHRLGDVPWVQVTYPGGMTGWVPQETLIPSSEKSAW
jgi:tetratricopeptide (TPR) repeat protein